MDFTTLYRLETSPDQQRAYNQQQQQQQQQTDTTLPSNKPEEPAYPEAEAQEGGTGQFAETYRQERPTTERPATDFKQRMDISKGNMLQDVQGNRFTQLEMERVGSIAENVRKQVESGALTKAEAQQVLMKAIQEDSKNISGWMRGKPETPWYDRADAEHIKDFVNQNKQSFHEFNKMQREVKEDRALLERVYDKKSPKYQKAVQALGQKAQRLSQLEQTLQQGLYGGEVLDGLIGINQARSEDAPA